MVERGPGWVLPQEDGLVTRHLLEGLCPNHSCDVPVVGRAVPLQAIHEEGVFGRSPLPGRWVSSCIVRPVSAGLGSVLVADMLAK